MSQKQFSFFATQRDLIDVLEVISSKMPLLFSCMDDLDSNPLTYDSVSSLPDLSIAVYGEAHREKSYMLIDENAVPKVRNVDQRRGGKKQIFDQLSHPQSVVLKPGGMHFDSDSLISGQVGTISNDLWSIDLYKNSLSVFKKKFKKVKSFYIGDFAMEKLESGTRLTSNIKSPREYDLKLS